MCKPTGEPGCKATLEKACAACGEHKPEADYSKKQFAAKSAARRCKACVAAGKEAGDVRDAQKRKPLPPGEYAGLAMEGESLQATLRNYLDQLKKHAECAPLALASYAFACVRCVAVDDGHSERPSWAEAWLVRAECELFLGELQAAAKKGKSSGKRPAGRVGPWGDEAWLAGEAADRPWEPSVPGHPAQRGGLARLHLADHWWGLDETTAKHVLVGNLGACLGSLETCENLADASARMIMAERLDAGGHRDGELVDRFRTVFAGSPFEPSDFFVRHLAREDQKESLWALAYVDDAKATLGVADCGNSSTAARSWPRSRVRRRPRGSGAMAARAASPGPRGAAAAARAVEFPRTSKASRATSRRSSRRPSTSRRVAAAAGASAAFRRSATARAAAAPAFANGALVTVAGLVSKAAHNGRSGDVLRWLPDKGRYEVMLKPDGDLASTRISLKPANLVIAS
ncbi:hypothetical protein JL721_4608 [Aureococcus anophagefferens]|nr:hypothetical protein JL721_4608 [Aureococcus anophagefferens]